MNAENLAFLDQARCEIVSECNKRTWLDERKRASDIKAQKGWLKVLIEQVHRGFPLAQWPRLHLKGQLLQPEKLFHRLARHLECWSYQKAQRAELLTTSLAEVAE